MTPQRLTTPCLIAMVMFSLALPSRADGEEPVASPFQVSAVKQHRTVVTTSREQYEITLGGTVDMDNTLTRAYSGFDVAFQPNVSLEIANRGDVSVENPRIVTNNKRRWWSLESLLAEILTGAETDQERALLIWDFVRKHRHHDAPLFNRDEMHDPVKFLCTYGGGLCDDSGNVGCSLLYHAGLSKPDNSKSGQSEPGRPKIRALHGHVMCEAWIDGDFGFLDIDEDAFYLDRENERLVSGDALARDHDLAKREHAYGPIFQGWDVGQRAAALFGSDDEASFRAVAGHEIRLTLRPGESVEYRWDDSGKFASDGPERRTYWGNSIFRYTPRLDDAQYHDAALVVRDIVAITSPEGRARLAGATSESFIMYEITTPFVICGGRIEAEFMGAHEADRFSVELSLDGENWQPVWSDAGRGEASCRVELDESLRVHSRPAKYRYLVRVGLGSSRPGSAQLTRLRVETDVMTSPHFLPRLSLGRNRVVYSDETERPHKIEITHRWQESDNIPPPPAPAQPIFPAVDDTVRASTFNFRWPAIDAVRRYHLQVSRYADMRLPYRTCFDTVVDGSEHGSPATGMFSPDTDYYWHVRAQNEHGVWSDWSGVWHFRWDGPRVAVDLAYHVDESGLVVITWQPNPRGPRPVAYEVYGSDERGFSVSREPYTVRGLGPQPANLLTETSDCEMRVVAAGATHACANRCYYRVVTVDTNGTRSGPSDYIELPHPLIYSRANTKATTGTLYRYELRTLRSLGDLQHRYTSPGQAFWEREEYAFTLQDGPDWLQLDGESGLLEGTPAAANIGTTSVVVVARRRYPHEVEADEKSGAVFQKTAPTFQASHTQRFELEVLRADGATATKSDK